jgi:hypothetical protein
MSPYRRFSEQNMKLADDWSVVACTEHVWILGDKIGLGESGSSRITRDDGVLGVAKPAFEGPQAVPRAAHEKIASDLAHLLGVPVPPVTLWQDPNPHGSASGLYAISAQAFRQFLNWDQSVHVRTAEFMVNVAPILAAGYVFHNWIDDTDHGGNGGNVVVDAESSEELPSIAFIDHAFSMSKQWLGGPAPCVPIGSYYMPPADMPNGAIADVVRKVQDISIEDINQIVDRIPVIYLSETRAELIKKFLLLRQVELDRALGVK